MKKKHDYFVTCNGLYFSFDFAERGLRNRNKLIFERKNIYSTISDTVCQLDLNVSRLVFKHKTGDTYYFEIVPVGGASDGK